MNWDSQKLLPKNHILEIRVFIKKCFQRKFLLCPKLTVQRDAYQIFFTYPHQFLRWRISLQIPNWLAVLDWLWVVTCVLIFCNLNTSSETWGWSTHVNSGCHRCIWKPNIRWFFFRLIPTIILHCTKTVSIQLVLASAGNCEKPNHYHRRCSSQCRSKFLLKCCKNTNQTTFSYVKNTIYVCKPVLKLFC